MKMKVLEIQIFNQSVKTWRWRKWGGSSKECDSSGSKNPNNFLHNGIYILQ